MLDLSYHVVTNIPQELLLLELELSLLLKLVDELDDELELTDDELLLELELEVLLVLELELLLELELFDEVELLELELN